MRCMSSIGNGRPVAQQEPPGPLLALALDPQQRAAFASQKPIGRALRLVVDDLLGEGRGDAAALRIARHQFRLPGREARAGETGQRLELGQRPI